MRMSDWSSDVCSSDLRRQRRPSVRRTDRKGHHAPGDRGSRQFPPRGRGMTRRAILKGTGSALPRKRVSNAELAERVDNSDEWIVERTGIRRSEEHTSELQSLMRISYAVFSLKKTTKKQNQ